MSERTEYPNGVPCWVTALSHDPERMAGFYADLFGWDLVAGNGFWTAQLRGRDVAAVAPMPERAEGAAWITQVSVDSADATAERARAAGATLLAEPFEEPMGRIAVFTDPHGAVVAVKEPGTRFGAQLVNEPSAWAMSRLETPDPDAAAAFYAEVFGWTTEAFGVGGVELFRLPGFVGGEPEQPVSREVVAVMTPSDADHSHWLPDFWVADLDAALAKVPTVHFGPADQPPFRTAVVADPAGATFSLSQLTL